MLGFRGGGEFREGGVPGERVPRGEISKGEQNIERGAIPDERFTKGAEELGIEPQTVQQKIEYERMINGMGVIKKIEALNSKKLSAPEGLALKKELSSAKGNLRNEIEDKIKGQLGEDLLKRFDKEFPPEK